MDAQIRGLLDESWQRYLREVPCGRHLQIQAVSDTGFHIQKYDPGVGYFRPHVDASSPNTALRLAAAIVYLNTVEEGGGTRFTHLEHTVDCVEGRVLWFPATWTYEHEGTMPISAPKWSISTFYAHEGQMLMPHLTPALGALSKLFGG